MFGILNFFKTNKLLTGGIVIMVIAMTIRLYGDSQYKRGQQYGKQLGIEETERTMLKNWAEREQTIRIEETRLNGLMDSLNKATAEMIDQYARTSATLDYRITNYTREREELSAQVQSIPDVNLWGAILTQVELCRE